jgi:CubicO group peptidase (beta-lactamase class C family)
MLAVIEARRTLERFLAAKVARGCFPGATYGLVQSSGPLFIEQIGLLSLEPATRVLPDGAIYDVASVTKPVITATVAMILMERGELDIKALVSEFVPEAPWGARMTLEDLLLHTSGLPAWRPLYAVPGKTPIQVLFQVPLRFQPHGPAVYSCLGYILLSQVLERVTGQTLRQLARELILEPLGMRRSFFSGDAIPPPVAPTEMGNAHEVQLMRDGARGIPLVRGTLIQGVVHDTNAFCMGGMPGNAGLFSTGSDLGLYASALLRSLRGEPGLFAKFDTARIMLEVRAKGTDEARSYGWMVQNGFRTSAGDRMGPAGFGHTGFTGCSLFFDPVRDLGAILLTNRVHPRIEGNPMMDIRRRFHDLCCEVVDAIGTR